MFAIERYKAHQKNYDVTTDKESILKNLKKKAAEKRKLKRKLSECAESMPGKLIKSEDKETIKEIIPSEKKSEEKNAKKTSKSAVSDITNAAKTNDDKTVDSSKSQDCRKEAPFSDFEMLDYDPLEVFKLGIKNPKSLFDIDLSRAKRDNLPEWVKHPKFIENKIEKSKDSDDKSFMSGFHPIIIQNLEKMNVSRLFPVQKSIIPEILNSFQSELISRPNDLCICSPTGSGKTFAFAIPIVQYMLQRQPSDTRALIILPTIELAKQVHTVFEKLCRGGNIHCVLLGSGSVDNDTQSFRKISKYGFSQNFQIVVSTPGRMAHILEISDLLNFENLKFLVIDEADRILDIVKQSWLGKLKVKVKSWCSTSRIPLREFYEPKLHVQKLLFSATLNPDPEKLKVLDLFQPRLYIPKPNVDKSKKNSSSNVTKYTIPHTLTEYSVLCQVNVKPLIVVCLLLELGVKKALCFTSSSESARRLHLVLKYFSENGKLSIPCHEFSALLSKKARKRNMNEFLSKSECVLVSSDAAARGIDAVDIEVVIIYDIPQYIEAYVHRAGRASRAGNKGSVFSLVTDDDVNSFKRLFRKAELKIPQNYEVNKSCLESLTEGYGKALSYAQSQSNQKKSN